jgi:MFS family permease
VTAAVTDASVVDSPIAWRRLWAALALSTIGGLGMWAVVVALPAIQKDFGVDRAGASLPYTLTMIGVGFGSLAFGRAVDRFGAMRPVIVATLLLATGFVAASVAPTLALYTLAQGLAVGVAASATFAPLLADTSLWFDRRRGIAVGIFASGNYLAGTIWPPVVQAGIAQFGWRPTFLWGGLFCLVTMLPIAWLLRQRSPLVPNVAKAGSAVRVASPERLGLSKLQLQALLLIAGVGCCVAMSMPQVHMVAYCADLGYGPARGAQMLSVMLACGIVSRLVFGAISDRIGGLRTLIVGSALQGMSLLLFVPFDGVVSLFLISAMFGLFQGGIVPSYAMIIREFFPPQEAGRRVSMTITATLFGMALGGWMSGAVFDWTASYRVAFLNGVAWNALNLVIATFLLWRSRGGGRNIGSGLATAT